MKDISDELNQAKIDLSSLINLPVMSSTRNVFKAKSFVFLDFKLKI